MTVERLHEHRFGRRLRELATPLAEHHLRTLPRPGVLERASDHAVDATGQWKFTVDNGSVQSLKAGESVQDTFTIKQLGLHQIERHPDTPFDE